MIVGILWALLAGLMLGLYALPEKFAKGFEFENTWGLFFFIVTLVIPNVAALLLVKGFADIIGGLPAHVLWGMVVASALWGIGVVMWGKAINYIGLSLGFSLFIGTIILVGSLLPFIVSGLPSTQVLMPILIGILVVLVGVVLNGKAGMARAANSGDEGQQQNRNMAAGIAIAVIGGLLATGFSYANAVGRDLIHQASIAKGNAEWVTSVIVIYIIYIAGGVVIAMYFAWQLSQKRLWGRFASGHLRRNTGLASIMAVFNFAASVGFAYAAFRLGNQGNTVGYAIFNTTSVVVAILSGIMTKEWVSAPANAKRFLYLGLSCMVVGVVVLAYGNSL